MKTCSRTIFLIGSFLGLLIASFTTYDACNFASENNVYIKNQTELAFGANEFKMVKYHAYKALTGIERSKNNFKNCGCDIATNSIKRTKENLKSATKSPNIKDAKTFIKIALKNTSISIEALENFESLSRSDYGNGFLTLNTSPSALITDEISLMEGNTLTQKIESGVSKFKTSLEKMIEVNECSVASEYVEKTHDISKIKSKDLTISPGKRYYHKRIMEVTAEKLKGFKDCK